MMKPKMSSSFKLVVVMFFLTGCADTNTQSSGSDDSRQNAPSFSVNITPKPTPVPTADYSLKSWKSMVNGNLFVWDEKELKVKFSKGKEVSVFSRFASSDYAFEKKLENRKGCSTTRYYRPMAVAGQLVSFEYESNSICGGISSASWGYQTFEFTVDGRFFHYSNRTAKPQPTDEPTDIPLSRLFSEVDILDGLLSNVRISNDLSRLGTQRRVNRNLGTLNDLMILFANYPNEFLNGEFYLLPEMLESFEIHDLEGDMLRVRISLTPSSHGAQARKEFLEVLLPIPEKFKSALHLAETREEGFLGEAAAMVVGNGFARFDLD